MPDCSDLGLVPDPRPPILTRSPLLETSQVGLCLLTRYLSSTSVSQLRGNGSLLEAAALLGAQPTARHTWQELTWTTEMCPCSTANVSAVQCRLSG